MKVSVVVPTFRRPQHLERCLQALASQTLPGELYEVLVCDDADSGEAAGIVLRMASKFPTKLRWLAVGQAGSGRHGPSAARNAGWRHARAQIIAFTDDDAIPDPRWLEEGLRKLSEPNFVAVAGRVVVPEISGKISERDAPLEDALTEIERVEFAAANCFIRREALQKVGGFDERFTIPRWEDADLHFSLLEYVDRRPGALRVGRCEKAIVVHPPRVIDGRDLLAQQRRGIFSALLYKKHPGLYRQRVQALPPLGDYVQVLAVLFALSAAARGHVSFAILALLAWLAFASACVSRWTNLSEAAWVTAFLPFVKVYWRLRGAFRFQVFFF